MTDKPIKAVDLSKLTPEQREAFTQFYKDAQSMAPQVQELKQVVTTLFRELLRTPRWNIHEAPDEPPRQGWHVGPPVINDYRDRG